MWMTEIRSEIGWREQGKAYETVQNQNNNKRRNEEKEKSSLQN